MSAKSRPVSFRVVVEPRGLGDFGAAIVSDSFVEKDEERRQARYRSRCEDIADQIRRHVDDVRSASVEHDEERVCEFCGRAWTEESPTYNGGCCTRDEEGNPDVEERKLEGGGR